MNIPTIKEEDADGKAIFSLSSLCLNDTKTHLEESIEQFLEDLGLDVKNNATLKETPKRFMRALQEMTIGYQVSLHDIVSTAIFDEEKHSKYVIVPNIAFSSLCEHHILPMFGKVYVAYIPDKKILGLSKFSRIVLMFSKRLQVQERFTKEIAEAIYACVKCKFVVVEVVARHSCMFARGAKEVDCLTRTQEKFGCCSADEKRELFHLLDKSFQFKD